MDKTKVYAQYHGRGILLLTSARLRRSLPQKDVEIPSLNTFKNRLNKPQWARLSSSYSHRAVTHSSSRPFEAWESLRAERGWAGCKAEIWSRVLQGVILHRGRHESDEWSALFTSDTLHWHMPSCIGMNSRKRLKAKHMLKGFAEAAGGLHTGKYRSALSHFHPTSAELW